MTARSGDALSHVNVQGPSNAVLMEEQCARILTPAAARFRAGEADLFRSYLHGGYDQRRAERTGPTSSICPLLA
jgi:hypothetical protein